MKDWWAWGDKPPPRSIHGKRLRSGGQSHGHYRVLTPLPPSIRRLKGGRKLKKNGVIIYTSNEGWHRLVLLFFFYLTRQHFYGPDNIHTSILTWRYHLGGGVLLWCACYQVHLLMKLSYLSMCSSSCQAWTNMRTQRNRTYKNTLLNSDPLWVTK